MEEDMDYDLMSAVRYGSLEKVEKLINAGGLSRSPSSSNGYFLLLAATEKDRPEVIELLLKNGCKSYDESASSSKTPLHFAVRNGDLRIIEMVLDGRADPNAKDEKGKTPLHIAIEQKIIRSFQIFAMNDAQELERNRQLKIKMDIIELLLKRGADANARTNTGVSLFNLAIEKSHPDIVKMLLNYGACPNAKASPDQATLTPLHCAILNDRSQFVSLLLENHANPNIRDADGKIPLHLACNLWRQETLQELLIYGADVNQVCTSSKYKDYTPLHFAASRGIDGNAKLLLDNGAKINVPAKDDLMPLHLAICARRQPLIRLLLERGANVNARTKNGTTVLEMAVESQSSSIVETILNYCPDLEIKNNKLCVKSAVQALTGNKDIRRYFEAEKNAARILEKLLEYGFTIDSNDAKNPKLLHAAVKNGCLGLVEKLLKCGADVNGKFDNETTPIRVAVQQADAEMLKGLLTHGAELRDSPDLLNSAVMTLSREIVGILLDRNVDVDAIDKDGVPALYCTTLEGAKSPATSYFDEMNVIDTKVRGDIAKLLLTRGANIHACTREGKTALHGAAALGDCGLIDVLLEYGANVDSVDEAGKTPIQVAAEHGHDEVLRKISDRENVNPLDKNDETGC